MSYDDELYDECETALTLDGFDGCDMGLALRCGHDPIIIYDRDKCIQRLMDEGMTATDAIDYFEFNVIGSWVGDGTPAFFVPNEDYTD